MKAQMASLVSRIEDNYENFEVFQGTLVSLMDGSHGKLDASIADTKEERKDTTSFQEAMEINLENM
jgi:hypothetical protein